MQPTITTHHGITISDYRLVRHMTCPFQISLPGFGALGARTLEEAHEKIEKWEAYQQRPAAPGEMKILAVAPGSRTMSASTMRNRSERARGQGRKKGRFA